MHILVSATWKLKQIKLKKLYNSASLNSGNKKATKLIAALTAVREGFEPSVQL